MSELSFEIGDQHTGMEQAGQAYALCQQYRLHSQQVLVKRLLDRHVIIFLYENESPDG